MPKLVSAQQARGDLDVLIEEALPEAAGTLTQVVSADDDWRGADGGGEGAAQA